MKKKSVASTGKSAAGQTPTLSFKNAKAWDAWLEKNHVASRGVWLKLAKKSSRPASLTYPEALDVALTYGWIDGQKKGFDEVAWLQRFTPRGAKSVWSTINREKVAVLEAAGKMKPAGVAAVDAAKADGRWAAAYDGQRRVTVPDDLKAALDANPRALAFFATLKSNNRYAVLFRVHTAKKPETRARRIAELVAMLARHDTFH